MPKEKNGGGVVKIERLIKDVQFLAKINLVFLGAGLLNLIGRYSQGGSVDPAFKAWAWALTEVPFLVLVFLLLAAVMMGRDNIWVSRAGVIPLGVAGITAIVGVNYFLNGVYETGKDFVGYLLGGIDGVSPVILMGLVFVAAGSIIYLMGSMIGRQKVKRIKKKEE